MIDRYKIPAEKVYATKALVKQYKKNMNDNHHILCQLLDLVYPDARCIVTGEHITYKSTWPRISGSHELYFDSRHPGSSIRIDENTVKYLQVSEQGMIEYFGQEYIDANAKTSNLFSLTLNKFRVFAFQLTDEDVKMINSTKGQTRKRMHKLYGAIEGEKRWVQYKTKQSRSNTFESKALKHCWTEEQFKEFNKSRAVTEKNLIKKHGEDKGLEIYVSYVKKQSDTSTDEYLLEKYGAEKVQSVQLARARNIQHYINKYGEEEGHAQYEKQRIGFCNSSKSSLQFFNKIAESLCSNNIVDEFKYGNDDEIRLLDMKTTKARYYDFTSPGYKFMIEYQGDVWHANPAKYSALDTPNPFSNATSSEIWKADAFKARLAQDNGYKLFTIWESDVNTNFDKTITELLNSIKLYINE